MKPKSVTPIMLFYLLFALLGLIVPWYFNLQHLLYSPIPWTIAEYFRQGTQSPLAASITFDFFIGTIPALVWMMVEGRRKGMQFLWLYFAGTFAIAFAFTYPLFLFFREFQRQQSPRPAVPPGT